MLNYKLENYNVTNADISLNTYSTTELCDIIQMLFNEMFATYFKTSYYSKLNLSAKCGP